MTSPTPAQTITAALTGPTTDVQVAVSPVEDGGLPADPGFYAWWTRNGSLPRVPEVPHPTEDGWGLLYVGIAPVRESSRQHLRARVTGNHLHGNTGSSTFRFSLASLLLDELMLRPIRRGTKTVLPRAENTALSSWQRDHLRISWAVNPEPWAYEAEVIQHLGPPLNLAGNSAHAFHVTMSQSRRAFRTAAIAEVSQ